MHQKSKSNNFSISQHPKDSMNTAEFQFHDISTDSHTYLPRDVSFTSSVVKSRHNSQENIPMSVKHSTIKREIIQQPFSQSSNKIIKSRQQMIPSSLSFRDNGLNNATQAKESNSFSIQQILQQSNRDRNNQQDINTFNNHNNKPVSIPHHGGSRSLDQSTFKKNGYLPSTIKENVNMNQVSSHSENLNKNQLSLNCFSNRNINQQISHGSDYSASLSMKNKNSNSNQTSFPSQQVPVTMNIQHFLNSHRPLQNQYIKFLSDEYNQQPQQLQQQQQQFFQQQQQQYQPNSRADSKQALNEELTDFLSFRNGNNQKMVTNYKKEPDENKEPNVDDCKNPFVSCCYNPKDLFQSQEASQLNMSNLNCKFKQQQMQQNSILCDQSSVLNYSVNQNRDNQIFKTQVDISMIKQNNLQDISMIKHKEGQDISMIKPSNSQEISCFCKDQSVMLLDNNQRDTSVNLREPSSFFRGRSQSNNHENIQENNNKEICNTYQTNINQEDECTASYNENQNKYFNIENFSKDLSVNYSKVEEISLNLEQERERIFNADHDFFFKDPKDMFTDQQPKKEYKLELLLKKIDNLEEANRILRDQILKQEEIHLLKLKDHQNRIQVLQEEKKEVESQLTSKIDSLYLNLNYQQKKYEDTKIQLSLFKDKKNNKMDEGQRGSNAVLMEEQQDEKQHRQLLLNIMNQLSVKSELEIIPKIQFIASKDVPKLLDCLRDMIANFAPNGCIENKPTIKQIWKWLKIMLKEYMNLKQSEEQNKQFLHQIFKCLQVDQPNDFITKLSHLISSQEEQINIIQQIKKYFHLEGEKWNKKNEIQLFLEQINKQKIQPNANSERC